MVVPLKSALKMSGLATRSKSFKRMFAQAVMPCSWVRNDDIVRAGRGSLTKRSSLVIPGYGAIAKSKRGLEVVRSTSSRIFRLQVVLPIAIDSFHLRSRAIISQSIEVVTLVALVDLLVVRLVLVRVTIIWRWHGVVDHLTGSASDGSAGCLQEVNNQLRSLAMKSNARTPPVMQELWAKSALSRWSAR